MVECLTHCCRYEEKAVFDLGFLNMKILCENNQDIILQYFQQKGNGIRISINFYSYPDIKISQNAAQVLLLFCKHGYVSEVNYEGGESLVTQVFNFF